ncbi:MAG TPA: hypothetical protein DCX06_14425 [Opitutae bacterium]|nr:hypothetical protein [Opitutae bacterium]
MSAQSRKRIYLLVVSMIAITVMSAFAIVWMQQQISRTAQNSKENEAKLADTVRKLRYLDERIATLHQPVVLQGKVAGVLRPSLDDQLVWVNEKSVATGRAYALSAPYEVSMDLALLDIDAKR